MKLKNKLLLLTTLIASTHIQAEEESIVGSRSFLFSENNNKVIELQSANANYKTPGDVSIDFYGHMAFRITSPKGLTMMLDPWRNDPTGVFGVWYPHDFPEVAVDIAMSSHAHFDHDALYQTRATMNLERMAGEFELGDVKITGVADKHQCQAPGEINWTKYLKDQFGLDLEDLCPDKSSMSWDNIIYIIETGGLKIGFWGDNRPEPSDFASKHLQNLDILIMNIDGSGHILSYEQVGDILNRYKPKTVIPGHYLTNGVALRASTLKPANEWVANQAHSKTLNSPTMTFNQAVIKDAPEGMVFYFADNYKTD
ncbi:MBL fold metallo-hydrolase [Enterovibrio norvegicus]|uniref:MBL fold metallo-hydrolase n=1 Tax=Enterovibrio norvegicus TaxID=188144 RepID=UPI0035502486